MMISPTTGKKIINLCWHCGVKFQGNIFVELKIDGAIRQLHKNCCDLIKLNQWPEYVWKEQEQNDEH